MANFAKTAWHTGLQKKKAFSIQKMGLSEHMENQKTTVQKP